MSEEKFTASNDYEIVKPSKRSRMEIFDSEGGNSLRGFEYLGSQDILALREFFQHERDEELGRWRDPEEPHFVVYPQDIEGMVLVVSEKSGGTAYVKRGEPKNMTAHVVAARYFAAHPEPKPWHDAQPGEVWELTYTNIMGDDITKAALRGTDGKWKTDILTMSLGDSVTVGRRIYPEAD